MGNFQDNVFIIGDNLSKWHWVNMNTTQRFWYKNLQQGMITG